jgi:hypothetical protein
MSDNVVNFLVPFLNASDSELRSIVLEALKHVFINDRRGEVSHAIVRKINHHLKTKAHDKIRPEMLQVLLNLRLFNLNEAAARQKDQDDNNNKNKKNFSNQISYNFPINFNENNIKLNQQITIVNKTNKSNFNSETKIEK